jgi:leader peptidase (prepilin peptidase) / N-methyltransferase
VPGAATAEAGRRRVSNDLASPDVVATTLAFVFGANVGSFLNVVAHRVPLGLSVVRPRSRCPSCRTPVRAIDNIPIVSWLLLRGRCRGCKGAISARYAVVEALVGALAAYAVHVIVFGRPGAAETPAAWAHAGAVFLVTATMTAAALIDVDHRILPDAITIPGMWLAPVLAALVPELTLGDHPAAPSWLPFSWPADGPMLRLAAALVSGVGIAVGAGVVWALGAAGSRVFGKEAMGFGDVKYLGMIGGCVGPAGALLTLVAAAFVGSVAGLLRVALTRDRYIPFGPFLAVGGYFALVHGRSFLAWYLATFLGR